MKSHILISFLLGSAFALVRTAPAAPAEAKPPFWAEKGAFIYRMSTPDTNTVATYAEQGIGMVANLTDQSVPQIVIMNGIVGHDHRGPFSWDGLWPY